MTIVLNSLIEEYLVSFCAHSPLDLTKNKKGKKGKTKHTVADFVIWHLSKTHAGHQQSSKHCCQHRFRH